MMREFLMLGKDYEPSKHYVNGWFMSEKLDGQRAFWDGGVTRNKPMKDIPWANENDKNRMISRATGLWSRYGNVVCAPDWFLDELPPNMLDGELYLGPGCLQEVRSIVSRRQPDPRWHGISYNVFEMPTAVEFCKNGLINNPNFIKQIIAADCYKMFPNCNGSCPNFIVTVNNMALLEDTAHMHILEQVRLPQSRFQCIINEELDRVVSKKGEGLMLRRPYSFWTPHRTKQLLKVKPLSFAEAIVIGYVAGLGKHKGRLGSLQVKWNNIEFDLGGFTDSERACVAEDRVKFNSNAGQRISGVRVPAFPLGVKIGFRYTGVTDAGVPREARFDR